MSFRFLPACLALILTCSATIGSAQMEAVPMVTEAWINAGTAQRSMIQSIGVRFNRNVANSVTNESLQVRHIATGALVDLSTATLVYDPRNNSANWMIDRDLGALLADGNYLAWIEIDTLLDPLQRDLMAVAKEPLDDFTFAFHQFVGDTDGDRDVDFRDASVLRETWQRNVNDDFYRSFLDLDLSNRVDESDRAEIETTYFTVLPPDPAIHLFLRNDTGEDPSDGLTSVYAVAFASIDTAEAESWQARLGEGDPFDITAQVANGSGALAPATIDQLHGSPLTPGNYQLTVEALDAEGNLLTADTLPFEFLGETRFSPRFVSEPSPGVALGQVEDAAPLNLATWTVERWPGSQGPASWVIAPDGLSVEQTINAAPSALISDQSFLNLRVTGTFQVDTGSDDDLMGFIFGYQNRGQFYVFDWKQSTQGSLGGTALEGMSIKRFDTTDDDLDGADFWWSNENRPNMTILAEPTGIGWEDFQEYQITLEFTPGRIVVEVAEEGTLLRRLEVEDDTFTGGRFGFYNYSQDSVIYRGFTQESLNNVYFYDAEAIDPDGGDIIYTLTQAPAGATVNPSNGSVIWQPDAAGAFPFTLVATDPDGLSDTQEFTIEVTPVDEPPTVNIAKTAPSVLPGEEISFNISASDDQQLFRVRFFIDGLEVPLDGPNGGGAGGTYTTSFSEPGLIEVEAIAIDSAQQVTSQTSYVRVRDPDTSSGEGPPATTVPPGGQVSGSPTDLRPLVSFDAPLKTDDDPTTFVGTVDGNGGNLSRWLLEWAPASTVDFDNLANSSVLWQELARGTDPISAGSLASITPTAFPDELIAFRLRAENTNGLGAIASIVFNPQSNSIQGPGETINPGQGVPPAVSFTAPLTSSDDPTILRGSVDPTTGTLQSWILDYAPRNSTNPADLRDPSVAWTVLARGVTPLSDSLLATLDPTTFRNEAYLFRLTALNQGGGGAIATLIFNPTSSTFNGPTGTTGMVSATAQRPVCRITSPLTPNDDRNNLLGSVNGNGGTIERWVVDYAPRIQVNPQDLSDPSVSWTTLNDGDEEQTAAQLASLDIPEFQNGIWIIRLRAFNTNGLGCLATTQLDTGDASIPTLEILSPEANEDLGYITEVRGSISGGGGVLNSWALEIAPTSEVSLANLNANANWRVLGSGDTSLTEQPLGMIDPTRLQNGSYILRLRARNTNGRGLADGIIIHVCGDAKIGNFRLEFQDLNIPLAGIPIQINRIYDTLNASRSGDFGYGWTLGIGDPDIRETVPDTGDSFFFATPFEIGTRIFLTTPDGRRVGFTFNVRNPRNRFLFVDYEPYFEPDPGVYESLTIAPVDFERVEVAEDGAVYTPLLPFGYNPDNYRLTTVDGLVYHYNQRSGLQSITSPDGQTVTFSGSAVTHSSGEQIILERDARNRITSIREPGGRELSYLYDSRGDLVRFQDNQAPDSFFNYLSAPAHFLSSISNSTDAAAGIPTFQVAYEDGVVSGFFDRAGNNISQQSYDPENFSGTQTDALGNVTTLTYNARGNILTATSPLGFETSLSYEDPANPDLPTRIVAPNGNAKSYLYNSAGLPTQETRADGSRAEIAYGVNGQVSEIKLYDTEGRLMGEVTAEYNEQGKPVEVVSPAGDVRTFSYDSRGRIIESTDFEGTVTTYAYSPDNLTERPNEITTGSEKSMVEYDRRGNITRLVDPSGSVLEFSYTVGGQILTATQNGAPLLSKSYNEAGQLIEEVNSGTTRRYTYDDVGNVASITEASTTGTKSVLLDYDAAGNLISLTDSEGLIYSYSYDADGRQVRTEFPGGGVSTAVYDGNDNLIETTDRRGYIRRYAYDSRNRRILEEWFTASDDAPVKTIQSTYDSRGQLTGLRDEMTVYEIGYDPCGLLDTITNAGSVDLPMMEQTFQYDKNGMQSSVTDQLGVRLLTEYDARGRIRDLRWNNLPSNQEARIRFTRNGSGALEKVERFTPQSTTSPLSTTIFERNSPTGAITRIRHLDEVLENLAPELDFQFVRDPVDRITSQSFGETSLTFDYDQYGQLESSTSDSPEIPDEFYRYDSNGNRTDSHLAGAATYGASGLPVQDSLFTYQHDEERNLVGMTSADGHSYRFTYDHRNRMTGIVKSLNGIEVSSLLLRYDPLDRIVARTQDGVTIYPTYVGGSEQNWADFDESGAIKTRYLASELDDHIFAFWTPEDGVQWPLQDQIGSTRAILRRDGSTSNLINYDSFGRLLSSGDPLGNYRFGFTGREHLIDDIYNLRTRMYSGRLGRFCSEDTIGFLGGDMNLHRYAYNNPLQFVDPLGTTADANLNSVQAGQVVNATISQALLNFAKQHAKRLAKGLFIGASLSVAVDLVCMILTGDPMGFFDLERIARKAGNGAIAGLVVATFGVALETIGASLTAGAGGSAAAAASQSFGSIIRAGGRRALSTLYNFAFRGAVGSVNFGAAGIGIANGITNLTRSLYAEYFTEGNLDCNGGFLPGVF